MNSHRARIAISLVYLLHLPTAAGQSLLNLGALYAGGYSEARAVSSDGSVVVGRGNSVGSEAKAFRWTAATGVRSLGTFTGGNTSHAWGVNSSGSIVVGNSNSTGGNWSAFRWTSSSGLIQLFSGGKTALSISSDGLVIVGETGGPGAFRWTQGGGAQSLSGLGDVWWSRAWGTDADGSVVVGEGSTCCSGKAHALRWSANTGTQDLGDLPGGEAKGSIAFATNADGSAVVGLSILDGSNQAFLWTQDDGMVSLGTLGDGYSSQANAVSGDGRIVVGMNVGHIPIPYQSYRAVIWNSDSGMFSLFDYLAARGVNLAGWTSLDYAAGISSNGRFVVGTGTFGGRQRAFLADLGPVFPCRFDLDGDHEVNTGDLSLLLMEFGGCVVGSACPADVDGTGEVDSGDLSSLLLQFGPCAN